MIPYPWYYQDSERDKFLADSGVVVMRFDNCLLLLETDVVIEEILRVMHERQIPPGPPLQSGENIKPPSGENVNPPSGENNKSQSGENIKSPFRKGDSGGFATDPIPHIRS